jgi:hypothetical protein
LPGGGTGIGSRRLASFGPGAGIIAVAGLFMSGEHVGASAPSPG